MLTDYAVAGAGGAIGGACVALIALWIWLSVLARGERRRSTHLPDRTDDVALWLKRKRDEYDRFSLPWQVLDDKLDEYRRRSDYGLKLTDSVEDYP